MSIKALKDNHTSLIRISIFQNNNPVVVPSGGTVELNIGNPIINQLEISTNGNQVLPNQKLLDELVQINLELDVVPDNQTTLYWEIKGVSSAFDEVLGQASTFKTGINCLNLGGRIFIPSEWNIETTGFTFEITNNGNHNLTIQKTKTDFKAYYNL